MLSLAAPQLRLACPIEPTAVSVPGAVGGLLSPTVALASFEAGPMLPAASSALTL
jgi:hypothetical protein